VSRPIKTVLTRAGLKRLDDFALVYELENRASKSTQLSMRTCLGLRINLHVALIIL
jgi:hypothetical protein